MSGISRVPDDGVEELVEVQKRYAGYHAASGKVSFGVEISGREEDDYDSDCAEQWHDDCVDMVDGICSTGKGTIRAIAVCCEVEVDDFSEATR